MRVFAAGNRVIEALEWVLRGLNPFEASRSRIWWLLRFIPKAVRRGTVALSAILFSYDLAQFLAMFCLFLASTFVQLTIKVHRFPRSVAVNHSAYV